MITDDILKIRSSVPDKVKKEIDILITDWNESGGSYAVRNKMKQLLRQYSTKK